MSGGSNPPVSIRGQARAQAPGPQPLPFNPAHPVPINVANPQPRVGVPPPLGAPAAVPLINAAANAAAGPARPRGQLLQRIPPAAANVQGPPPAAGQVPAAAAPARRVRVQAPAGPVPANAAVNPPARRARGRPPQTLSLSLDSDNSDDSLFGNGTHGSIPNRRSMAPPPSERAASPPVPSGRDDVAVPQMKWFCATMDEPRAPDVVLLFPRRSQAPRQLWVHRSLLVNASAYWASLFESEMAESQLVPAAQPLGDIGERVIQAGDISESDGASDDEGSSTATWAERGLAADAYRITVRDASYTTYRAVLGFLVTGRIAYAPLRSRGAQARAAAIRDHQTAHPSLPALVSPKQVYVVADKLELAELKNSALCYYIGQIDKSNIASEAFSNASAHPEIETPLLSKLAASWTDVRTSPSMAAVEKQVGLGKRPRFDTISRQLIKRLRSE